MKQNETKKSNPVLWSCGNMPTASLQRSKAPRNGSIVENTWPADGETKVLVLREAWSKNPVDIILRSTLIIVPSAGKIELFKLFY